MLGQRSLDLFSLIYSSEWDTKDFICLLDRLWSSFSVRLWHSMSDFNFILVWFDR